MRIRRKKHAAERMERCGELWIKEPAAFCGRWHEAFGRRAPLHVEIGCGKGRFIREMTLRNPDINFLAIEKIADVLVMAMEGAMGVTNLRFVLGDAENLTEFFAKGECDKIYLNFSDPWPKKRHAKRRLTHPNYLAKYKNVLKKGGVLQLKTDSPALFEFSLSSMEECGYHIEFVSHNLYADGGADEVMTEYEQRFFSEGKPIHKLIARPDAM